MQSSSSAYITPTVGAPSSGALNGAREGSRAAPPGRLLRTQTSLPVFGLSEGSAVEGNAKGGAKKKLGMFKGVLVPTCENMWGVIIFLRFYTIVGYAGLGYTILIVTLSFMVALLTALALSAIATCGTSHNLTGVYPMMARALGREVATATGLVYFVGIVCLAVLECLGACEELFQVAPELADMGGARVWGLIFLSCLSAFVAFGIKTVSHLGLVFFAVVIVTLSLLYLSLLAAPILTAIDKPVAPAGLNGTDAHGSSAHGSGAHLRGLHADFIMPGDSLGDDNAVGAGASAFDAMWSGAAAMLGRRQLAGGGGGPIDHSSLIFPSGLSAENFANNFGPAFEQTDRGSFFFGDCLSIFFPCFTGILSGANRANSLRDPVTAIPNGTLGAIIFSYFMYLSLMCLWAGVGSREYLKMSHGQINTIFYPSVMGAQFGIILSSLGQALQCLVVAPRLLASISASETIRRLKPLAVLTAGEPKRALLVTYLIGASISMLGSLNLVAPLLSMCFLLCYACMNLNSFFLDFLKDPHWRPKWRFFHWSVGLAGFVLCTTMMFLIQYIYALVAWSLVGLLLAYILRSNISLDYGSALTGLRFHVAIRSLLSIDMSAHLVNNWKPQLLVLYALREVEQHEAVVEYTEAVEGGGVGGGGMSGGALPFKPRGEGNSLQPHPSEIGHTHEHMLAVAHQLRHGSGLIIAGAIMQMGADQHNHDLAPVIAAEEEERKMQSLMNDMGVRGFAMAVLTHDVTEGKAYAIQCAGLGPLTPNTVLMGWPWWWKVNPDKYVPEFLSTIHQATLRQKALLVCHDVKDFPTNDEPQTGYIDVWWIKHDGGLLLLISHLLQKHRVWRQCRLRLHLITEVGTDTEQLKARVHKLLNRINISAHVEEVIQIDTASLLPYMIASHQRERNEQMAERELRAQGHDHQAEVHTAEEFLAADSPRLDPAHPQRPRELANPLEEPYDKSHDASKHDEGRTYEGAPEYAHAPAAAIEQSAKKKGSAFSALRRSGLTGSKHAHHQEGRSDAHYSDSSDGGHAGNPTPQMERSHSNPDRPTPTFSKGFRKGDLEYQRQAAAFAATGGALSCVPTPASLSNDCYAAPGQTTEYYAMGPRMGGRDDRRDRRNQAPHLQRASHDGIYLEERSGLRTASSALHLSGMALAPAAIPERPGSALGMPSVSSRYHESTVDAQLSAIPIDTTGDGHADAWAIDTTRDGRIDTIVPAPEWPRASRSASLPASVTPPPSPPEVRVDSVEGVLEATTRAQGTSSTVADSAAANLARARELTVDVSAKSPRVSGDVGSPKSKGTSPQTSPNQAPTSPAQSPAQSASRWSLMGASTNWGGSRANLSDIQLPPQLTSSEGSAGAKNARAERPSNNGTLGSDDDEGGNPASPKANAASASSPTANAASPKANAAGNGKKGGSEGGGRKKERRASHGNMFSPILRSTGSGQFSPPRESAEGDDTAAAAGDKKVASKQGSEKGGMMSGLLALASGGGTFKEPTTPKLQPTTPVPKPEGEDALAAAQRALQAFAEKHGLTAQAAEELQGMFHKTVEKVNTQTGPSYRWDQIHEMIVSHSPGTSLVIVNLPDPPELAGDLSQEEQMEELLEYMNYMEGVACNLPRTLYVHGSGQEIINFDKME